MGKTELRINIDENLLRQAQAAGLEVGSVFEEALRAALPQRDAAGADARAALWAEENAEAIRAYNSRIARRGVFGADLRRW